MIDPLNQLVNKPFVNTMVLFRIPKSASSTLYSAIGPRNLFWREKKVLETRLSNDPKYAGLFDPTHVLPSESYSIFGRGILNFFSVCCVRNPFDRAVSSFFFSRGKNWGQRYGLPNDGEFSEYCEAIYKMRGDKNFWPVIPQTVYSHGVVPIKCVLRFETLQESWSSMIKEFDIKGLPDTLPHENATTHKDWREYYGPNEKAMIQEIFHDDFERLNYS